MLQGLGVEAVSAWDGEEALARLAAEHYEVVLMDCHMPKLDGYETTRRFRDWEQAQHRPRTPIVALTANALSGDAEKCFAAGMDRYLSKPFTSEQLCSVLESCVGDLVPPVIDAQTENAILDPEALGRIRALDKTGVSNLFAKVVELYCSSSRTLTSAIRTAALSDDRAKIRQAAHALRSSSANVGAMAFSDLCQELEQSAAGDNPGQTRTLVEQVLAEHKQVLEALEAQNIAA